MNPRTTTGSCSRRSFLRGCGLTLAGFGVSSLFPGEILRHAMATTTGGRRLLFIFLRGGNDGLNAVIPHGDPDYNTTYRPNLYIPPASAIDLGNGFASLHPSLAHLMEVFNAGDLAILHRVGYADNSRSHFDGQRIWENGDPAQPQLFDGWLARYIANSMLSAGKNLPVISAQPLPPLLLRGEEKFVNIADPSFFDYIYADPLRRAKFAAAVRARFEGLSGLEPYRPALSQTGVKLVDTIDEYKSWNVAGWDPRDPNDPTKSLFPTVNNATNPGFGQDSFPFFNSLKVCALALLESDGSLNNGTRVAGTEVGGWDLHNGQGQIAGRHAELLSWLAYGLRSLRIVLSGAAVDTRTYTPIWDDTVVMTMSEFGRTTVQNGSGGSDHAAASCLFLEGGRVNGGIYNCDASTWPPGSMFASEGRYLLERTDYRAVFWEVLRDHMGAGPASVETMFPGYTAAGLPAQELGLISTA